MNLKKYLEKLEMDTSLEDLKQYASGAKQINNSLKKKDRENIKTKVLPKLIKKLERENAKFAREFVKAPILKLAYHHCILHKIDQHQIFDVAKEIVDRINKDDKDVAVKKRFSEYVKRTNNAN